MDLEHKPNLGLATTRQLLDELRARIEVDGKLDYRTVGGDEAIETITFSEPVVEERKLPEGKRAVRTKTTGDMVYVLDEVKKTRSWVKSPEVLAAVGFEMSDVIEVDTEEFAKYSMAAPTYRVD